MNVSDISSTVGLIARQQRDMQSVVSRMDRRLDRLAEPSVQRGQQLVALTASRLARMIGNGRVADELEEKAAASPAMTTVATWAQELSSAGLPSFVLSLQRRSALATILAASPQVSLLKAGAVAVPVAGAAPPAVIVVEGGPIPIQRGSFTALSLLPFKLAAILHYTEELQNASNIEAITRTLLEQSVAAGMDAIAFGSTLPGGLLNGVTPIAASTATPLETAMRQDLQNLLAALTAPSTDVVFVMSPGRAAFASSVLPSSFLYQIAVSTALPAATVVAVDPQGVAAALSSEPRIAASISAAAHESDVPLALGTGVQGSGVMAVPMRSAFQTDTILVRVVADVGWAARTGAVASITAVSW
jgi:hypothetical protein